MVLLIMLGVLAWRFSVVLRPDVDDFIVPPPPKPGDLEPTPPPPPPPPPPQAVDVPDPFRPGAAGARPGETTAEAEIDLEVLSIQLRGNGQPVAQIGTRTDQRWLSEGDSWESYQLRDIDPDTGCCEIWSEDHGRVFTRCLEE